jgi:hypothetical protein
MYPPSETSMQWCPSSGQCLSDMQCFMSLFFVAVVLLNKTFAVDVIFITGQNKDSLNQIFSRCTKPEARLLTT